MVRNLSERRLNVVVALSRVNILEKRYPFTVDKTRSNTSAPDVYTHLRERTYLLIIRGLGITVFLSNSLT